MSKPVVAIVRPYTSAALLAPALRAAGISPVAVMDYVGPQLVPLQGTFQAEHYDAIVNHHGDFDATLDHLGRLNPVAVIPGVEASLHFAERLAAELTPARANVMELVDARRHKYQMHQALAAAGLPVVRQICTTDPDDVARWIEREGLAGRDLVVKPTMSAATVGVSRAARGEGWREKFTALLGHRDKLGVLAEDVLVQEYMTGTEYVVDTVSCAGRHSITDILKYRKIGFGDGMAVYDSVEWLPFGNDETADVVDYGLAALDAVGLRNWAAHTEIMLTAEGPRLLEINARLAGDGNPLVNQMATGESQVTRTVDVCAGRGQDLPKGYTLHRKVMAVYLIAHSSGVIRNAEILDKVRDLPSFYSQPHPVHTGDRVDVSTDLFTMSMGYIVLAHERAEQVYADRAVIREMERQLVIEP